MLDLGSERIVITGGDGFLGRHLQQELLQLGVKSENLLVPVSQEYNLTQQNDVVQMYKDMRPSVVIHLAAQVGGIGANRANPGRFFYANMAMGLHLIEGGRVFGVKKFVQVGTTCSYPKFPPVPFREENLWDGFPEETNAPYGIAKKALLVMLQAYRQQYGFKGIYLLPVNLYGPGDNFDLETSHVIPALVRKFCQAYNRNEEQVTVWGSGSASREFLYVQDAARGIMLATEHYDGAEPVNLGSGFEITIKELADKIKELTGFKGRISWDTSKPDGQPRRCLDTSKAKEYFHFTAQTVFEEGLRRTISWWREQGGEKI